MIYALTKTIKEKKNNKINIQKQSQIKVFSLTKKYTQINYETN